MISIASVRPLLLAGLTVLMNSLSNGQLIVANKGDQSVGIIDTTKDVQVAEIPERGITAHEVAVGPDGRVAYAPIYGNSGVGKPGTDGRNMVVVDLNSKRVVGNVDFGHGVRPHCPIFNSKDQMLYVTTELDKTVSIIDPKNLKIVGTIPTGQAESHMLAITHDGKRGYTANVGPGTVSVLDIEARKEIAIIPISPQTQRISVSMDDTMAFTADQTQPRLAVIDTAQNKVKTWVPLPAPGYGTAPTPDGRWLVVAVPGANKVSVVDLQTMKVVKNIDVPKAPQAALVRPDGKIVYVSCDASHKIAAIDTNTWEVVKLIDAGKTCDGMAWAAAVNSGT